MLILILVLDYGLFGLRAVVFGWFYRFWFWVVDDRDREEGLIVEGVLFFVLFFRVGVGNVCFFRYFFFKGVKY